jgi:hypothetical protein
MKGAGGIGAFLVAVLLVGLWEMMHQWWFWAVVVAISGLIWYYLYQQRAPHREAQAQISQKPQWVPPPTRLEELPKAAKIPSPPLPDPSEFEPKFGVDDRGILTISLPEGDLFPPPTGDAQADLLVQTRLLDAWDAARKRLQQISYGMVSEAPEAKAAFTKFMKIFAERDPLLSSVLNTVMPLVRAQPGILQTATYKHLPGIGVEEVRYVLYFAEQLGILRREKKGNTYRLLPAGDVIEVAAITKDVTMIDVDCQAVSEGLWELFKQRPELRDGPLALSEPHEAEAVALLQALCQKRWAVWDGADDIVKGTARALTMDFFAKVAFPRQGEFQGRRWRVEHGTPLDHALAVVAQELAKSHPGQAKPH